MKIDICLAKMMEYKSMDKGYVIVIKGTKYFLKKKLNCPEVEFNKFEPRQNWVVPLKIAFNVSSFKPALNYNLFLGDLRRGLNSLNSDSS